MDQNKEYLKEKTLLSLALLDYEDKIANDDFIKNRLFFNHNSPQNIVWFIPYFDNILRGGIRTIFNFAQRFSEKWGTFNTFVIDNHTGREILLSSLISQVSLNFPSLKYEFVIFTRSIDKISKIPQSDLGICTLWSTAYLLVKYNNCKNKMYFVQDFEPLFYEAGSIYGCIEETYRFGFDGIVNSKGTYEKYISYGNIGEYFTPAIDHKIFYEGKLNNTKKKRIVFYGRPHNARNAFVLCTEILRELKKICKNEIEIISVGADWKESDFNLERILVNRGTLYNMSEIADLYRSSDFGLTCMFTTHPSYQPLEYMACGCIPITNINTSNSWLFKNGFNSIVINSIPSVAAQQIANIIHDESLILNLRKNGLSTVKDFTWDNAFSRIESFILNRN